MPNVNPIVIQQGSTPEPTTGDYLVRFIDFDGTILKSEWVDSGNDATAPDAGTHTNLTFNSWNNTFTNITRNTDVGAMYDVTDGKTYLFVSPTTVTGLQPTIYLTKADTQILTINWGDGTSQTSSASGNISILKTAPYASVTEYEIDIECDGDYSFENSYAFANGNYQKIITKFYAGANCTTLGLYSFWYMFSLRHIMLHKDVVTSTVWMLSAYSLKALIIPTVNTGITGLGAEAYSLQVCVIPTGVTSLGANTFRNTWSLISIVLPTSTASLQGGLFEKSAAKNIEMPTIVTAVAIIGTAAFIDNRGLEELAIPSGITNTGTNSFLRINTLRYIDIPVGVTTIGSGSFYQALSLIDVVCNPTTPPTMANINAFQGINVACKIYVPDASVTAYKTATNWTVYADYIYPLSERP